MDQIFIQIFLEGSMKSYNGIEVTENFYEFFAPYFLDIISHINDPREQENDNLQYRPTVCLGVTSVVVYTYGYGDGRIGPTRCAVIDGALGGRWSQCQVCRTPPAAAGLART